MNDIIQDVKGLLSAFGFALTDADAWLVNFLFEKVEEQIKNACNVNEIPSGLNKTAACLVVSEFFQAKRTSGIFSPDGLRFDAALKQLQEGDTNIVFDIDHSLNNEQKLDLFIASAEKAREQFVTYRRLKW